MSLPLFPDAPAVDPQREGWTEPPFQAGSHASYTGAQVALATWSAKQSALLQFLSNAGAATRQELAAGLSWPLSSVCSTVKALIDQGRVERTGEYDTAAFESGMTRRERLRIHKT